MTFGWFRYILQADPEPCPECGEVRKLVEHHITYEPEVKEKMCVNCHNRLHNLGNTKTLGKTYPYVPRSEMAKENIRLSKLGKQYTLGKHWKCSEEAKERMKKSATEAWQRERKPWGFYSRRKEVS